MDGPFFFQIIRNSSSFFIPNSLESEEVSKLPRPWNSSSWNSSLENLARKVSRGSGLVPPIPFYSRFSRKNGRDLKDLPLPSVPTLSSPPSSRHSGLCRFRAENWNFARYYASLEIPFFHYRKKKERGRPLSFGAILYEYLPRFDLLTLMQILDTGKEPAVPLCQVRTWKQNNFCKIRVIIRSFNIWIIERTPSNSLKILNFHEVKDKAQSTFSIISSLILGTSE